MAIQRLLRHKSFHLDSAGNRRDDVGGDQHGDDDRHWSGAIATTVEMVAMASGGATGASATCWDEWRIMWLSSLVVAVAAAVLASVATSP